MAKWESPKIVDIDSLPAALGHCRGGSSEIGTACANGEATTPGVGPAHNCFNGGVAGEGSFSCGTGGGDV